MADISSVTHSTQHLVRGPLVIGLISDTHGYLDPRVLQLFAKVDHILHAGDIGSLKIVDQLEELAPVTAVLGNTDDPSMPYREVEFIELANRRVLIHHIVDPYQPTHRLSQAMSHHRPDTVVFGHTHKVCNLEHEGCLYLNPGYSGRHRYGQDRSVALLHFDDSGQAPRFDVQRLAPT